jgi:hypothetical protein
MNLEKIKYALTLIFTILWVTGAIIADETTTPSTTVHARRLSIAGVTPYSKLKTKFYDCAGKKYPNFIALAHAAGANAVRLSYPVNGDKSSFYKKAKETKKRGMQLVCTIYPSVNDKDFTSLLKTVKNECKKAVLYMKKHKINPELLLVGNEINTSKGYLNKWASWKSKEGNFMVNTAKTLKAATKGIRSAGYKGDIGVHIDRSWSGFFSDLIKNDYTDYQVAAISLYPKWGDMKTTVEQKVQLMHQVATKLSKKILVIETAAPYISKGKWKTQDFDIEHVVEVSPRGQKLHLKKVCKLVLSIPEDQGLGVITWGSDLTMGIHKWDHVTWNRAQVTKEHVALPSLYVFKKYGQQNIK